MTPSNYHTHTTFCDGNGTPEELVLKAIELGCPEIGFSGHSYTSFDDCCCMTRESTEQYKFCIRQLKQKYADKIKILLGVEQDFYSDDEPEGYDYVIGSVHYLYKNGEYLPVDVRNDMLIDQVNKHYGGDIYAYAEHYFDTLAQVWERTKCDIIGHFDLITKFNEGDSLFDTTSPRYRNAALRALDALCASPAAFEVNTGAIARGYRKTPYPADFILKELKKRGKKLIFSSDCHDKEKLLFGYDTYLEAIK